MATNGGAVVVDANVLIAIAAKETLRHISASAVLNQYSADDFVWYAPGAIVSESLYVLCNKLNSGVLSPLEHEVAIDTFEGLVQSIVPPPNGDRALVRRAEQIRSGYGCSRSADGLYIALAEHLTQTMPTELLTFDQGVAVQAAANAPTVRVRLL